MIKAGKTYTSKTDEQLMQLLVKGDEKAFDQLYQRYSRKMMHYFYRMLQGASGKAEDFTHDLFVKLIERPHLFDPRRKFSSWLYTVAGNMIKNEYRSQKVRHKAQEEERRADRKAAPKQIDILQQAAFATKLEAALEYLNPEQQEVFVLRYQQELPLKEISEIMGCTLGTTKSRLFYSLKKLATHLQEFNPKLHQY